MDNDPAIENRGVSKAKSCNNNQTSQTTKDRQNKIDSVKRKSVYVNDGLKSLDLDLGRLKKSKLVNGDGSSSLQISSTRTNPDVFMDSASFSYSHNADNASLMSMNFSHYELMRNLSRTNCNSDGAYSGTTCNTHASSADTLIKDERLERYFRSAEIWNRNVHFKLPEN